MDRNNTKKRLETIKALGVEYMRSLTIHERGKGPIKKYFIRPTINGKTLYVSFPSREAAETFLSILPPTTTSTEKKVFIDYYLIAIGELSTNNTKSTYINAMRFYQPILKKSPSEIKLAEVDSIFKSAKQTAWVPMKGALKRICNLSSDPNLMSIQSALASKYKYKSKVRGVKHPTEKLKAISEARFENKFLERTRIAFVIMCYTGLRIGEFLCLTPKDIEGGSVNVCKTLTVNVSFSKGKKLKGHPYIIQQNTKGKDDRTVPLTEDIIKLFNMYFAFFEKNKKTDEYKYIVSPSSFRTLLRRIEKELNLKDKITPHSARHIFGTIYGSQCKDIGEAIKLQMMLGHKDFSTTQRYISIANPTADDIASKMPKLSGGSDN